MQPLTPNERRYLEGTKKILTQGYNAIEDVSHFDASGNLVLVIKTNEDRDLWLKVLSMALETNEALSRAWAKAYQGDVNPFRSDLR